MIVKEYTANLCWRRDDVECNKQLVYGRFRTIETKAPNWWRLRWVIFCVTGWGYHVWTGGYPGRCCNTSGWILPTIWQTHYYQGLFVPNVVSMWQVLSIWMDCWGSGKGRQTCLGTRLLHQTHIMDWALRYNQLVHAPVACYIGHVDIQYVWEDLSGITVSFPTPPSTTPTTITCS